DGGTVLGHSSEPGSTTSYTALLTQIASKSPEAIYFGGLDSTGGILVRQQMQQVPALRNLPLGGGDGLVSNTFASTIGLNGGSTFGTVAVVDTTTSTSAKTFRDQYGAVYGAANLSVYSASAYDCANIIIQAIKTALANGAHTPQNSNDAAGGKAFRQAVISAIQGISYVGVTGHQAFDANGDTTNKVISIYQLAANTTGKPDWIYKTAVKIS
ncbi:MAG TPA: branched-chain amino acid ABC transporter substrate-binding protein, partial [Ktedonobacter sp.]|nr:branched-chain amino acid ABC transporter substrate-binding protein [Ktedonobacter sp.]